MWGADWRNAEFEPSGISFNLTIADWMNVFAATGFTVDRYQELFAPEDAQGVIGAVPADWAKDFPVEQVWHLTRV